MKRMTEEDKERLRLYLQQFKTNMEILENAIEVEHIPNIYATLSAFNWQVNEITTSTAKRLYKDWQDGKID